MSEGDRDSYLFPGVGDIEMSSSGGISTTLSPTKRKRRRKKVKIIKKKEALITIPTLGEVSKLEPPVDLADIEKVHKKVEQEYVTSNTGNQFSESSSNKFSFVLPDLGEAMLTNTDQVDIQEIGGKSGVTVSKLENKDHEGSNFLVKKHSLSNIAIDSKYPYFTKFPPFNKSFYKPRKLTLHRIRKIPIRLNDFKRPPKRKPINILSNFVENSLSLLNLGPKWIKPRRKNTEKYFKTANGFESGPTIKEKFDVKQTPFLSSIKKSPFLPNSIPLDQMSQEFMLAHLVLVSIPLLFTGKLFSLFKLP
jgi:hypothetical protein